MSVLREFLAAREAQLEREDRSDTPSDASPTEPTAAIPPPARSDAQGRSRLVIPVVAVTIALGVIALVAFLVSARDTSSVHRRSKRAAAPASSMETIAPSASTEPETTPPPPPLPSTSALVLRSGARGVQILVPSGWTLDVIDGGGSGSTSTWSDPNDPDRKVVVRPGVSLGGWWELDGVSGSIDPTSLLPANAQVSRLSYTTFAYRATDSADRFPLNGVWIADVENGSPLDYRQADVNLPESEHSLATQILNSFTGAA